MQRSNLGPMNSMHSMIILQYILLFSVFLISIYLWSTNGTNQLVTAAFALSVITVFLYMFSVNRAMKAVLILTFILLIPILSLLFVFMQSLTPGDLNYNVAALGGALATVAALLMLVQLGVTWRVDFGHEMSPTRGRTSTAKWMGL